MGLAEGFVSDINTESPVDPSGTDAAASVRIRVLRGTVIFLGILIVLGLGALIAGIFLKGNHQDAGAVPTAAATQPEKPRKPVSMTLVDGYQILSIETQPGRLILHVRSSAKDEIDIIDLDDGRLISQIHADAPK